MRCATLIIAAMILPALPLPAPAQPERADPPADAAPASPQRGATLVDRIVALAELQPREHRIIIGQISFEDGRLKLHEGFDGRRAPGRSDIQRVLNDGQPLVALILEASRQWRVDLGLPPGPMPVDATEQLEECIRVMSALRQAYRLLRLDIGRRLEDGALDSAVDRIEGGLGFCAAIDPDSDLLVHMTRGALVELVLSAVHDAAAQPDITPMHRKRLLDQLDRFDADDPYNYGVAARANAAEAIRWLRAECAGPEAGERLADIVEEHGAPPEWLDRMENRGGERGDDAWGNRWLLHITVIAHPGRPAAKLSDEQIEQRIAEIEALVEALLAVWAAPGEERAIDAIYHQMSRDDSQIAKLAGRIAISCAHTKRIGAERIAEAREALRGQQKRPARPPG